MPRRSSRSLWTAKLTGQPVAAAKSEPQLQAQLGMRTSFEGIILGIDPSLRGTGLAVVAFAPNQSPQLLASETVNIPQKVPFDACLGRIHEAVVRQLKAHEVKCVASEETISAVNAKVALILGAARGAAIAAVAAAGLRCLEYKPARIKQAVTGSGRASKQQVAAMMAQHLGLKQPLREDEADAAATACCCAWTWRGD
ncbi:MAG: crossover junction endodeoxyribonuclease RuvC [Verrucomicrobiota bacterium]